MKIIKSRLQQIIREELQYVKEQEETGNLEGTYPLSPGLAAVVATQGGFEGPDEGPDALVLLKDAMEKLNKAQELISKAGGEGGEEQLNEVVTVGAFLAILGLGVTAASATIGYFVGRKILQDKANIRYAEQNMKALEVAEAAVASGCEVDVQVDSALQDKVSGAVKAKGAVPLTEVGEIEVSGGVEGGVEGKMESGARLVVSNCRV